MYTLQNFIEDLPIQGLTILSRPADLSSIPVSSISAQELPLDAFVRENEIVLSTLISCWNDEELFQQFLRDIKRSKAAALVVCFQNNDYVPSQRVLDCAAEIGLPLLRIPWEIRFAEVIHFTLDQIHEKNIEGYKRVQEQLFNAYFTSQSLDDAAGILSRFFHVPVAIAGRSLDIKGRSGKVSLENAELLDIRINSFLWGHLYICQPEDCAPLLKETELLGKYIALPLSLWFNRENIESMTVLKLKNDFVWNLANQNYTSFQEMMQQGAKLGFDLTTPHLCIALRICPQDPRQAPGEYSTQSAEIVSQMENLILAERRRLGLKVMFADRGLMFILYVEVLSDHMLQRVEKFVSALDLRFAELHPSLQLYWGMSETSAPNSECFHTLCQNAQLALRYCTHAQTGRHIFTYRDTRFHQIISELSRSELIRTAAQETLSPLLNYDKGSSMELIQTLMEFLKNNGNSSLTARNLHLNRQSLLYRLKKIEALTGMSLSQRKDLFLLEIYTRIHSDF